REAQQAAYALVDVVDYAGKLVRRDIGYRAVAREEAGG
ncbi:MAG: Phosphoribosylglycinamide synthetase, domain, partial [Pseudomonadota bacterium]